MGIDLGDIIALSVLSSDDKPEPQLNIKQVKKNIIAEMRRIGMILPEYDWDDADLDDTAEAITADWFERHPEVIRGSGQFQKLYPEKMEALDILSKMTKMGRITPDEYISLYREINNF